MTKRLEEVLKKLRRLSAREQDELAAVIEQELAGEREWDTRFAASQPVLDQLAAEARREDAAGDTEEMTEDRLGKSK